ncbi:MAG TPA: hypothetical protein RMH85_07885 [Polyangiaceae bacterium LLY-WYZ-15_(1-7)]|nr:hypothetical protein [Sandaracinus sp.]HJL02504.1 hypothetical protein [Polyangiaceae bacterium LLY-WYZ-15_(1-7)]HJL08402.1 hypothetical protein [Polyangiaceae bacterium LLY-WYZ-15_(1-7)]HJL35800.1 hypothetical protein [Polyangiaceae bacterium LLY-WYZ-15_(1-7)]
MIAPRPGLRRLFALAPLGLALACGGGEVQVVAPGDAFAEPSMEALPSIGQSRESLSETMRFAWQLTEESFELAAPHPPPRGASHAELEQWSDSELERWLHAKNRLVEAARAELNAAAEENRLCRVWAGALVGLMYEDVARVLLDVPMPRELASEPEIADVYREVVAAQAAPYLDHARRAYRACHLNGRRVDRLRPWSRFCADRRDRLPGDDASLAPGESETTVEVVRE